MRANDEVQHLYSFGAVYPDAHWGKPAWFWMPAAQSSVFCVCVCVFGRPFSGLLHMCLTLLWQGCPASLGRWRMSETRVKKRAASQHLMEWETHSLDGWPADATAWEQSGGWRPSKTPIVCLKYHSLSSPFAFSQMCTYPLIFLSATAHTQAYLVIILFSLELSGVFSPAFSQQVRCLNYFIWNIHGWKLTLYS